MASLREDIKTYSIWLVKAFKTDKLNLDYSFNSIKEIDEFFNTHSQDGKATPEGRLSQNLGPILFAIGSYIGETFVRNIRGAEWVTDENNAEGEVTAAVIFPDGSQIWPMQKVVKRFQNGPVDNLYEYAVMVAREYDQSVVAHTSSGDHKRPWWKFW
jgi:hypothetical protein